MTMEEFLTLQKEYYLGRIENIVIYIKCQDFWTVSKIGHIVAADNLTVPHRLEEHELLDARDHYTFQVTSATTDPELVVLERITGVEYYDMPIVPNIRILENMESLGVKSSIIDHWKQLCSRYGFDYES